MKVILVNGSSHTHGTTMKALEEMIRVFEAEGIETEVIQLGSKPLADCLQCNACLKTGKCVFKDDGVNEDVYKRQGERLWGMDQHSVPQAAKAHKRRRTELGPYRDTKPRDPLHP